MANTFVDYTGADGTGTDNKDFAFSFPYLDDSHIVVQVDQASVPGGAFVTKALTTDYTIVTSPSKLIRFVSAPASADRIRIKRDSASDTALVDFENGSVLTEVELDRAYLHNLYLNEEIEEGSGKNVMTKNSAGNFEADLAKIVDLADPTLAQDAATKNYVDTEITTERIARIADVDAEETARIADVNAEETARIAGDALKVAKAGDSMTGELAMGNNKITGLATPTATTDASNKSYVDSNIASTLATGVAGGLINTGNIADDAVNADKLAHTAVTPGSYTNTNITVDQQGRITTAASGTANELLTSIKTVDGTGSGLDADLLDGQHASEFVSLEANGDLSLTANVSLATGGVLTATDVVTSNVSSSTASVGNYWLTVSSLNIWNRPFVFLDQVAETALQNKTLGQIGTTNSLHLVKQDGSRILELKSYLVTESVGFKVQGYLWAKGYENGVHGLLYLTGVDSDGTDRQWNTLSSYQDAYYMVYPEGSNVTSSDPSLGGRGKFIIGINGTDNKSNLEVHGDIVPPLNNTYHLGSTALRFDNLWNDGTFNGSDENLKQDIEDLDEAEKRVAVKAKALIKKYRFKRAVAKKGDDARIHVGIIAQELKSAFESEGLDAFRYSMIGQDTWWEKEVEIDDDIGKRTEIKAYTSEETAPSDAIKKTQMSVNYSELLAFIISAL
jgi:hypothetical protein